MVNPGSPENNDENEPMLAEPPRSLSERVPLKAHTNTLPEDLLKFVKEEHAKKDIMHLSLTELLFFICDDSNQLLELECGNICVPSFGFQTIQHNDLLVQFYTGLPDASQFCYIAGLLRSSIFRDYIEWGTQEKRGFMNHTMMCLMKLRLGMSDEELAERFRVEPYVVKMTNRLWIPAISKCVYVPSEELYAYPVPNGTDSYTKVLDVVEVCLELPEFSRGHRGRNHRTRRAVLGARSDGYVCFAGDVLSEYVPEDALMKRSRFATTTLPNDVVLVHPELESTLTSMGVSSRHMTDEAYEIIARAADRIAIFKILAAIPQEYSTLATDIFKSCAALCNFILPVEEEDV